MAQDHDSYFLQLVEAHERQWGHEGYPGRPKLTELLNGPIVALWFTGTKTGYQFSVHQKPDELNELVQALVLSNKRSKHPHRKLAKIFVNQQPIKFSVRIVSEKEPAQEPAEKSPAQETVPIKPVKPIKPIGKQPEVIFTRAEPTIAKLIPLPKPVWIRLSPKPIAKHPGSSWGESLPGRNPELLPGSKRGKK